MPDFIIQYSDALSTLLFDPKKRIFIGYLAISLIIAIAFLVFFKNKNLKQANHIIFSKKIWLSKSSFSDAMVIFVNQAFLILVSPYLLARIVVATFVFELSHEIFDGRYIITLTLPNAVIAFLYSLCYFIIDDASKYLLHRAMHQLPFLWFFHKTHHSAETLTPFTVHRIHPIESLLYAVNAILIQGVIIGIAVFFFGNQLSFLTILGANIFIFVFNILGSNIRHSHIPISYGQRLEKIFISPAQHQIHHSCAAKHYDKNFGSALAIWDILGRTHYHYRLEETIIFGLNDSKQQHRFYDLYLLPFVELGQYIWRKTIKIGLFYHQN